MSKEIKTLKFWNSKGKVGDDDYENFIDSISGEVEFVKSHMGGNYGPGDEYIVTNPSGKFRVLYYGDSSAKITKIN